MGEEKPQKEDDKSTPTNKKKKVEKNTGLTISSSPGTNSKATISTYDGGEKGDRDKSNIYEDPNTGSTIATKEARTNIAQGGDYQVVASTSTPNKGGLRDTFTNVGQTLYEKPLIDDTSLNEGQYSPKVDPIAEKQKKLISEPRPSEDLLTGAPLKYSGPGSTTSITKMNPSLRRGLLSLGSGLGDSLRRYSGLQRR